MVVGDAVHLYVYGMAMGKEVVQSWQGWNDLTWGNLGITTFLLVSRLSWFAMVGLTGSQELKKVK
jgi:hypothetical protein